jgi:hypothetical protein
VNATAEASRQLLVPHRCPYSSMIILCHQPLPGTSICMDSNQTVFPRIAASVPTGHMARGLELSQPPLQISMQALSSSERMNSRTLPSFSRATILEIPVAMYVPWLG